MKLFIPKEEITSYKVYCVCKLVYEDPFEYLIGEEVFRNTYLRDNTYLLCVYITDDVIFPIMNSTDPLELVAKGSKYLTYADIFNAMTNNHQFINGRLLEMLVKYSTVIRVDNSDEIVKYTNALGVSL